MICSECGKKRTYLFPIGDLTPCHVCKAMKTEDLHRKAFPRCQYDWHDNYDQFCREP